MNKHLTQSRFLTHICSSRLYHSRLRLLIDTAMSCRPSCRRAQLSSTQRLINLQQLISSSVLIQRIFAPFHNSQYLFFLQPSPYNLDTHWQASHLHCIVVLVGSLRNAVELLEGKRRGERVLGRVDVGHGDDAGRVVEL
jgi:hypothetical protein